MKILTWAFSLLMMTALVENDATAQRTPLMPVKLTKIEYPPGGTRNRFNPATKQWEKFALDQKIVYDEPSGNFLLQWNGVDGKRKTIVYRPATRLHAVVSARIEFKSESKAFRYVYAVRNLPKSQRELQSLYIEADANVEDAESPDETWSHSSAFTDYLRKVFQAKGGWTWAQVGGGRNGLQSGESSYGFSFQSVGLPAPVKCYVAGRPGMKGVGEDPPEELMAALDSVSWWVPNGVTVGPVPAPEKLDSVAFLKQIDGMIDVGLQQGWILSSSIAGEVRAILRASLASLERNDCEAARGALERSLKRIEEEKEKRLLSEAYALLRYNIEYLIPKLCASP